MTSGAVSAILLGRHFWMKKLTENLVAGGVLVIGAVFMAITAAFMYDRSRPTVRPAADVGDAGSVSSAREDLLYGRVILETGTVYEGRLRWGTNQEALWGNYFNAFKTRNPWAPYLFSEAPPNDRGGFEMFGIQIGGRKRANLGRPFLTRFGDVARVEPHGRDIQVTLKSGTTVHVDAWEAHDFADGVRVWDARRGPVDIGDRGIRSIELLTAPEARGGSSPLYGTVRTLRGDFTGLIQWDREQCLGSDTFEGRADGGDVVLTFDSIRAIAQMAPGRLRVMRADGRELVFSTNDAPTRGVYVDDRRYGRVLVTRDAFERVDFTPGRSGPAFGEFPPGRPLTGRVATRDGRRLTGRLVFDLDESETTDTLDAPAAGIDYMLPFGLVASINLPAAERDAAGRAAVTLHSGEELRLDLAGDLGDRNAGLLVFADDRRTPEYVRWSDVDRIELDRPAEMYPPIGAR